MDKPADPATPFREVYQSFLDALVDGHPADRSSFRSIVRWSVIDVSSSSYAGDRTGRAAAGSRCSRSRRSSWALAATTMVDALIAIAPTAIDNSMPHGVSTPMATGIAMRL